MSSLTGMFVGMHVMLAMKTGRAEWAISEDEGKSFMNAAQKVASHYSVETTQKTLDWIALAGITVGIYGPRVVALNLGGSPKPKKAKAPIPPGGAEIFNYPGAGITPEFATGPDESTNG